MLSHTYNTFLTPQVPGAKSMLKNAELEKGENVFTPTQVFGSPDEQWCGWWRRSHLERQIGWKNGGGGKAGEQPGGEEGDGEKRGKREKKEKGGEKE